MRYYHPALGAFLTQDPFPGFLHLPATLHSYQYALNDPLNLTDPSGEIPPLLLAAGIGAGIGGAMGGIHYMLSLDQPQPAGDGCCGAATSNEFQWSGFGRAVAIGATSGAVGGLVGYALPAVLPAAGGAVGAIGGGAVTGAVSAGAEQVAFNLLTACAEWYDNVAEAMVFGGVIGGITGGVGYKLRPSLSTANKSFLQPLNRNAADVAWSQSHPNAPGVLDWRGRQVGRTLAQNRRVQMDATEAWRLGAVDIRINQQQVNAFGQRVGRNRPDLQYTLDDIRYYVEYERVAPPGGRGLEHEERILGNDPGGLVIIHTIR